MRRLDATTVISPKNFRQKVWHHPVEELLFVGRATQSRLNELSIFTIADIAKSPLALMRRHLGKNGEILWRYARGQHDAPVLFTEEAGDVKSIGNNTTTPHDVVDEEQAKAIIYLLSDSIAARLRKHHFACRTVSLWMRDTGLSSFERQQRLTSATDIADEIACAAMQLLREHYLWHLPMRSLGVRGQYLVDMEDSLQMPLPCDPLRKRSHDLEHSLDFIRGRWGHNCIQRGLLLWDSTLSHINPVDDHDLQPLSAMNGRE